eukprot:TRINITY_DN11815_c0_g1_i1.p1 TRINITY_DN11815_c0_g1~~TRINITY_DN11815_c0_g1_i1.p1  ORF type:complete len:652 (+),score=184.19 TRINITY_DN11815_c0_g1_i1:56-1957(+)
MQIEKYLDSDGPKDPESLFKESNYVIRRLTNELNDVCTELEELGEIIMNKSKEIEKEYDGIKEDTIIIQTEINDTIGFIDNKITQTPKFTEFKQLYNARQRIKDLLSLKLRLLKIEENLFKVGNFPDFEKNIEQIIPLLLDINESINSEKLKTINSKRLRSSLRQATQYFDMCISCYQELLKKEEISIQQKINYLRIINNLNPNLLDGSMEIFLTSYYRPIFNILNSSDNNSYPEAIKNFGISTLALYKLLADNSLDFRVHDIILDVMRPKLKQHVLKVSPIFEDYMRTMDSILLMQNKFENANKDRKIFDIFIKVYFTNLDRILQKFQNYISSQFTTVFYGFTIEKFKDYFNIFETKFLKNFQNISLFFPFHHQLIEYYFQFINSSIEKLFEGIKTYFAQTNKPFDLLLKDFFILFDEYSKLNSKLLLIDLGPISEPNLMFVEIFGQPKIQKLTSEFSFKLKLDEFPLIMEDILKNIFNSFSNISSDNIPQGMPSSNIEELSNFLMLLPTKLGQTFQNLENALEIDCITFSNNILSISFEYGEKWLFKQLLNDVNRKKIRSKNQIVTNIDYFSNILSTLNHNSLIPWKSVKGWFVIPFEDLSQMKTSIPVDELSYYNSILKVLRVAPEINDL